tara:strand:+ start:10380 stop:11111 length:732 start_codon:yes stop_codon:yes gene_type:complete
MVSRIIYILVLMMGFSFCSNGQEVIDTIFVEVDAPLYNLKPLDVLIDSALIHSPLLHAQNVQVEITKRKLRITQQSWLSSFAIGSGYYLGKGNNLNLTDGSSQANTLTTTTTASYSVGASFSMPLTTLISRKSKVRIDKLNFEIEKDKALEIESTIRKTLIIEYNNLLFKIQEMNITLSTMESNKIAVQIAKKYLDEGELSINGYTEAIDKRNGTILAFEKAKTNVKIAFLLLREITGTEIEN